MPAMMSCISASARCTPVSGRMTTVRSKTPTSSRTALRRPVRARLRSRNQAAAYWRVSVSRRAVPTKRRAKGGMKIAASAAAAPAPRKVSPASTAPGCHSTAAKPVRAENSAKAF